jgi:hypothetical protein
MTTSRLERYACATNTSDLTVRHSELPEGAAEVLIAAAWRDSNVIGQALGHLRSQWETEKPVRLRARSVKELRRRRNTSGRRTRINRTTCAKSTPWSADCVTSRRYWIACSATRWMQTWTAPSRSPPRSCFGGLTRTARPATARGSNWCPARTGCRPASARNVAARARHPRRTVRTAVIWRATSTIPSAVDDQQKPGVHLRDSGTLLAVNFAHWIHSLLKLSPRESPQNGPSARPQGPRADLKARGVCAIKARRVRAFLFLKRR